jgi:hypothetical protein
MDIKIVGEVQESKPIEMKEDSAMGGIPYESEKKIIAEMYGLDEVEAKRSDDKVNTLLEYAKSQNKELTPEALRWTLRELELKLGTPPISETMINYMARYAYLMTDKKQIEEELKKFY